MLTMVATEMAFGAITVDRSEESGMERKFKEM